MCLRHSVLNSRMCLWPQVPVEYACPETFRTLLTTARSADQVHLNPLRGQLIPFASKPPPDAMDAEYNLDDLFNFQEWASQRSSQLPGTVTGSGIDASPLPESVAPSTTPNETPRASSQRHCPEQAKLTLYKRRSGIQSKHMMETP